MPTPVLLPTNSVERRDDVAAVVIEKQPSLICTDAMYVSPSGRDDDTMATAASAASTCSCYERFGEEQDTLIREKDAAVARANELQEQLDAMISATNALARLVKQTPADDATTASTDASIDQSSVGLADDDMMLDQMVKRWRLEDTGFVSLYSSCKAMQSNLRLTRGEANAVVEELANVKTVASEAKSNLKTANKALNQLWEENVSLKLERKKLAREIKAYVNRMEQEKQTEIERAVSYITHEHSLSSVSFDRSKTFDDELSLSSRSLLMASPSDCSEGSAATVTIKDEAVPLGDLLSRSIKKAGQKQRNIYKITVENRKEIGIMLLPVPVNPNKVRSQINDETSRNNFVGMNPLDGIGKLFRRPTDALFVVVGFSDVDACSNKRPLLGARLVAVDSLSLETGNWSLKEVAETIRSREGPVSLSFRNEIINDAQVEYLNKKYGTSYPFTREDSTSFSQ